MMGRWPLVVAPFRLQARLWKQVSDLSWWYNLAGACGEEPVSIARNRDRSAALDYSAEKKKRTFRAVLTADHQLD
jgi:hypothetical protein